MGRKPNTERSDLENGQPKTKAKQRDEEYIRYRNYIRSKQFREVKKIVWERDGGCCQFCGRKQSDGVTLSVHHRNYSHLFQGGEVEAADCILICSREHKVLHSMKCNYRWFSRNNSRNNIKDDGTDTIQDLEKG